MDFWLRNAEGDVERITGEPYTPPDSALRPWAIRPDDQVVYADWGEPRSGLQGMFDLAYAGFQKGRGQGPLRAYDKAASQQRRQAFETLLALNARDNVDSYISAVNTVSENIIAFVENGAEPDAAIGHAGSYVKSRCFNDTGSGRMGTKADGGRLSEEDAWGEAKRLMRQASDVPKILGIQVAMATKLTQKVPLSGVQQGAHDAAAARVAPTTGYLHTWFDPHDKQRDGQLRGRRKTAKDVQATATPGIMPKGIPGDGEMRKRGVDSWEAIEDSSFAKGSTMRNIPFGAGRSGTTGSLLITYRTFGGNDDGEEFKKYLLATVVYLVTGGHHSCHEIFSIANLLIGGNGPRDGRPLRGFSPQLVKEAYVPGKYVKHLPASYMGTEGFKRLSEKYYDIAIMGHLHGTFA